MTQVPVAFTLMQKYCSLLDPDQAAKQAYKKAEDELNFVLYEVESALIQNENEFDEPYMSTRDKELVDMYALILERLRDNLIGRGAVIPQRFIAIMPTRKTP